jgi:hypothetical protein
VSWGDFYGDDNVHDDDDLETVTVSLVRPPSDRSLTSPALNAAPPTPTDGAIRHPAHTHTSAQSEVSIIGRSKI